MQNFAINGGLLNGDPEVWGEASAAIALQAAGDGMRGAVLDGAAQVRAQGALSLAYMAKLTGSAAVPLSASGSILRGATGSGQAGVVLKMTGAGVRWAMIESAPTVHVEATGDIGVSAAIGATFNIIWRGDMDLHVARSQRIEGLAPVVLKSDLDGHVAHSLRLVGHAKVELASIGLGALVITSPPGAALIQLDASGSARLGAKVGLEGYAALQTYARGQLESWHYVYAEGVATVEVQAMSAAHGTPIIPGFYIEAPVMRALRVGEETRRLTVPAERRAS